MTAVQRRKADEIRRALEGPQMQSYIRKLLAKHMSTDRFLSIAIKAVYQTPQIAECDPKTVLQAILTAAQLGLEPDNLLGHAYLVPISVSDKRTKARRWVCHLWLGYQGLIELARRSGEVLDIQAQVVREGDKFRYRFASNGEQELVHEPSTDPDRHKKPITHVWAMARLKNGVVKFEVMTKGEIDAVRQRSAAAKRGHSPWDTDYDMMARKTVLRRLCKTLPMQTDVLRQVQAEEQIDAGVIDVPAELITHGDSESKSATERLKEKVVEQKVEENADETGQKTLGEDDPRTTEDGGPSPRRHELLP